ncbi:DUF4258 domain-containing protein [Deinococcus sp.]|uniref:DUF4258 domain-containing protein n=1 Tax=Deinococcus sp. TaxID=47478 RepID=UPI0026003FCB|nr:DUF4258 domain-containing protein [Deinococcus sp.]
MDWELTAIWQAVDQDTLLFSRHARQELSLDALTFEDATDVICFPDEISKDLPGGTRAPGLNFDRHFARVRFRVKVGWNGSYYIVVTAMSN